jgi:uncharacterized membrane-anchored protein
MNTIEQEPIPLSAAGKFVEAVKGRERWVLTLGIALQLGVLLFMTVKGTLILVRGDVYYVRVQPVDPRDLMRGDYVILSYEFSRLPHDHRVDWLEMWNEKKVGGAEQRDLRNQPIYVSLEKEEDGKHWRASRFSLQKPGQGPFLRGTMNQWGQIEFGIEQYFVQEGKGRAYEDAVRSRRLSSEIAITPEGAAAMRGLHILDK